MRAVAVLCAHDKSHYFEIPGIEVYDRKRDARNFNGNDPVICHPPCAQWSRLRAFANVNQVEKDLAWFCLQKLKENGGVFEHPHGSLFFKVADFPPGGKMISVDQNWWGYPARKRTLLYFYRCTPLAMPMNFDAITHKMGGRTPALKSISRTRTALTTLSFDKWLVDSIRQSLSAPVTLDKGT